MVHEFKAGDWVTADGDCRMYVIGRDSEGELWCQEGRSSYCSVFNPDDLTPLPGCTGWDWEPEPDPAEEDVVYVCISVKRSVWDAVAEGDDIPAGSAFDGVEIVEIASMPGARLFLRPD